MPPLRSPPDSGLELYRSQPQTLSLITAQDTASALHTLQHAAGGGVSLLEPRFLTIANHDPPLSPPLRPFHFRDNPQQTDRATGDSRPATWIKERLTTSPQNHLPVMDGATDISILSEAVQREVTRPAATLHRHRTNNATASGTVEGEPGLTEQELQFIASLDDSPIAHFLKYTCEYLGAFRNFQSKF
ncbi:hypothetical protein H2199_000084 [Coniosporium tulheliwenetii]|uniref:Uncharacterized protein n=1 Tax=Coniosporium tulheliwenetii TaxID=3383036 RepID=A0ACC2ZPD1_9PEZI|nr:hypothetical protein H2199_000084 [Cladosporium sp. JES 115]